MSDDGLAQVSTRGPGRLYMRQGHPAGDYDHLMIGHVGLTYAKGQDELPEDTEEAIFDMMIQALARGVDAEFSLAREPGPCTLKLGLYLVDIDFYDGGESAAQTRFVNSFGAATLVFEFRDSMTDQALVRYGLRRSLGSGVDGGAVRGPDLERLNATFFKMMGDVGRQMQEVLPVPTGTLEDRGCNGNIGRAVHREARATR